MSLRNLFIITALITLLSGVGLTFFPVVTMALYNLPLDEVGIYSTRFVGGAYLSFAAMAWLAKDAGPSQARTAIIVGFLVVNAVSFFVSLGGVLFGPASAPSLTTVLITLLLAVGFGYFFIKEPRSK